MAFGFEKQCIEGWKSQQKSLASVYEWWCLIIPLLKTGRSYVSRIKTIATEMYKCENAIYILFLLANCLLVITPNILLRNGEIFEQPIVDTKSFGLNSFRYEDAKIWNELPNHIQGAYDLISNEFKGFFRIWSGPSCRCQNSILCSMSLV